ncbi:Z1 domain-containing protein [Amnibacterium setariae]|nr:Z1 domain-containing protein [Amnibacterium setariae]
MSSDFYPVFAQWARAHGLEAARSRFRGALKDAAMLAEFVQQYEEARLKVLEGGPVVIPAAGKEDWYPGPLDTDRYWSALKAKFEADGWPSERVANVDNASNKVVSHTPSPNRSSWKAKGLVVGYVQSGKTTNFLAAAAKLADLDYRLIVVLSGVHNGLRKQTQERLEEALAGVDASLRYNLTDEDLDFRPPPANAGMVLKPGSTALAVVKKNGAVLRKLVRWLETPAAKKALIDAPVLIIDDEADQASIATARINPLIRRLIELPAKSTYIGYTATPFANVFIDPSDRNDLYPRDFILNLPRPDGYFGPEKIFGMDVIEDGLVTSAAPQDGYDMIRIVPDADVPKLRPGTRNADNWEPELTAELSDALDWFLLATAVRRLRSKPDHSTMLIHTSVKIAAHVLFEDLITGRLVGMRNALGRKDPITIDRLRELYRAETARVAAAEFGRDSYDFEAVLAKLPEVLGACSVVLDNYKSDQRLDYSGEPVVAIAIGGNTLSRGLTLEGLVVSFFVRSASAYDTLLQMGRWFGYRNGYEDLPRIWMTADLRDNFRHLSQVEYEMRDDIERYQREDLTPEEVAVRIRTHPALRITAKMGAASPAYISFAGRRFQTRYFKPNDRDWLEGNQAAADRLVTDALMGRTAVPRGATGARLIEDVPVELVLEFLRQYRIHPDSPDLDPTLLTKYIEGEVAGNPESLTKWSLAVVEADGNGATPIGPLEVGMVVRNRLASKSESGVEEIEFRADIKTLMSKEDRVADLGLTTVEARNQSEPVLAALRDKDEAHRARGLLVLYAIAPNGPTVENEGRASLGAAVPVIGIGLVFPGIPTENRRVRATHLAVDLANVGVEVADDLDAVDEDAEDPDVRLVKA